MLHTWVCRKAFIHQIEIIQIVIPPSTDSRSSWMDKSNSPTRVEEGDCGANIGDMDTGAHMLELAVLWNT